MDAQRERGGCPGCDLRQAIRSDGCARRDDLESRSQAGRLLPRGQALATAVAATAL